jgi:hypothetical protein
VACISNEQRAFKIVSDLACATCTAMCPPLQFFGSYDYARMSSKKVVSFWRGLLSKSWIFLEYSLAMWNILYDIENILWYGDYMPSASSWHLSKG